jgi:hypothetical protein
MTRPLPRSLAEPIDPDSLRGTRAHFQSGGPARQSPKAMKTPASFPATPREAAESAIGAQWFFGVGADGASESLWLERQGDRWSCAWTRDGQTELACAWVRGKGEKTAAEDWSGLIAVWGGPLADGLARTSRKETERFETVFLTLRLRAGLMDQCGALPEAAWAGARMAGARGPESTRQAA